MHFARVSSNCLELMSEVEHVRRGLDNTEMFIRQRPLLPYDFFTSRLRGIRFDEKLLTRIYLRDAKIWPAEAAESGPDMAVF